MSLCTPASEACASRMKVYGAQIRKTMKFWFRAQASYVHPVREAGAPYVRVTGDALRVSTITKAVYQGYHTALDI